MQYHLRELGHRLSSAPSDRRQRQQTVRNRRFAYMERVLKRCVALLSVSALTRLCPALRTDYFSVEKMRERAPFLYETSVVGSVRVRPTRFPENLPLSERLMANIDSDRRACPLLDTACY